ncbi:MAG: tetraacyldisaccharide 4'-kinase, partial [Acetobacteraceae bacterium]
MRRAPGFWWRAPNRPGLLPRLLAPLGWLYAAATSRRLRQPGYTPQVPVICVGNLTAGGAGKTPTVIALIGRLSERGKQAGKQARTIGRAPPEAGRAPHASPSIMARIRVRMP